MRIGPPRQYDKRTSLYDAVADSGTGSLTGVWECGAPSDVFIFMEEQFKRFGVPFVPELMEGLDKAASQVLYFIDSQDPYAILINLSDITVTDAWSKNTYEIHPSKYEPKPVVCDPEHLETFAYVPGQAEHWFNWMMANPGLEAIPYDVGKNLMWVLDDLETNPGDHIDNWEEFYRITGDNYVNYLRLAAWCTFVWIAGPLGRDWRMDTNSIFDICLTRGECIMYKGAIIDPKQYTKTSAPAGSCYKCQLDSWCNEIVDIDGVTRYVCEFCLNDGKILYPGANCGSRMCKYVACPRHPNHQEDLTAALYATMRNQGLLTKGPDRQLIA